MGKDWKFDCVIASRREINKSFWQKYWRGWEKQERERE
jgi:hypothetical protein